MFRPPSRCPINDGPLFPDPYGEGIVECEVCHTKYHAPCARISGNCLICHARLSAPSAEPIGDVALDNRRPAPTPRRLIDTPGQALTPLRPPMRRGWAVFLGWVAGLGFWCLVLPLVVEKLRPKLSALPEPAIGFIFLVLLVDAILVGVALTRALSRSGSPIGLLGIALGSTIIVVALTAPTISNGSPLKDFEILHSKVTALRFFESGPGVTQNPQRVYATQFERSSTQYVNWELDLSVSSPSSRVNFPIESVWYGPDGKVVNRSEMDGYILPGWTTSWDASGWGCDHPPCQAWQPGLYKVVISIHGTQVASGSFEILGDVLPKSVQPQIESATAILPLATQTITIRGSGFGTQPPYNGDSSNIRISDLTRGWNAGKTGDAVSLNVFAWSDTQITIDGFTGAYNSGGWSLTTGDNVEIQIWNAQTGVGPAVITSTVAALSAPASPVITSVTPILPQAVQTFSIKGSGFGVHAPYDGDCPYILISDVTQGWNAGRTGDRVSLNVAEWRDDQITIQGFTGGYDSWVLRDGDELLIRVWNVQTGTGPAATRITASMKARVQSPYSPAPTNPPVVTWHPFSSEPRPAIINIPSGTSVKVFTLNPISSNISRTGDIFRGSLAAPILIDGRIALQSGTSVYLRVLEIRGGGHKELTEIRLVLDHLMLEGKSYPIDSSEYDFTNPSGKDISVSAGAQINFQLIAPITIVQPN